MMAFGGLPAAMRSCGRSTPWSTALRTRWTSGSLISSIIVLSISVSSPESCSSTSLPIWRPRSRAMRTYFWNTRPTGCIRAFITEFCRSPTTAESCPTIRSSCLTVSLPGALATRSVRSRAMRFLIRPTSPDRFRIWSKRSTSMRSVVSLASPDLPPRAAAAGALAGAGAAAASVGAGAQVPGAGAPVAVVVAVGAGSTPVTAACSAAQSMPSAPTTGAAGAVVAVTAAGAAAATPVPAGRSRLPPTR